MLWVSIENDGFGASQSGDSVTSIPAGFFFVVNVIFDEKHDFYDFSMIRHSNESNLSSNRGTTYKTGILDPIEFWWVP